MLHLPRPSLEQQRNFVDHLGWAHSWYKHLPLLSGGQFLVFLSEDAGSGYDENRPRLHYSWKTTDEYRQRFGYLDYAYQLPSETRFQRDIEGNLPNLPAVLLVSFTLYPFVSTDFNAQGTLFELEQTAIERLREGKLHPFRQKILTWSDAYARYLDSYWELTGEERETRLDIEDLEPHDTRITSRLREYLEIEINAHQAYEVLFDSQQVIIFNAIAKLLNWLDENTPHTAFFA
jgi:hypothetical protein